MGKIIAISNQKGGVGKTTTSVNLSAILASKGKKILLIDVDPQGNSTTGLGVDKEPLENTTYELLLGGLKAKNVIIENVLDGLDLIPAKVNLSGAEIELAGVRRREHLLKKKLKGITDKYDYIFIDCPPSLNMMTVNALAAADKVLVPVQTEFYALEGLSQLVYTIDLIKRKLNTELVIDGIVFTMADFRNNLTKQVIDNVKENVEFHIYDTIIPRNVRLAEAPSYGLPINIYDSHSIGASAYRKLANEFIAKHEKE